MRKSRFERLSKRAQPLRNVVETEGDFPCSMLVSIERTRSMTDWFLTKQVESSVRSEWLIHAARLAKLDEWLSQQLGSQSKDQMACSIIETTHSLLIAFLLERGWPVYAVNPLTVDRKRSASGAKTGRADFADLHRLTPDSEKVAELKTLTRDQDSLIQMQTRFDW